MFGTVGIDTIQGPTEAVLVADESTSPEGCAADILAQAEHDPQATSILISTSARVASEVDNEVERQLGMASRESILRSSLEANGAIILIDTIEQAIQLSNLYAPEHLCLLVRDAERYVSLVGKRRRPVPGRGLAPRSRGLRSRPQPRPADGGGGPVQLGSRRERFPKGYVGGIPIRPGSGAVDRTRLHHSQVRGTGGPRTVRRVQDAGCRPARHIEDFMTARNTESGVMKLVRPHLRDLVGYRGVQPAEKSDSGGAKEAPPARIVKLDGNENPYGSSPKIRGIFDDESLFHLYPDPNHRELRAALADYVGVGTERIVAGAGADELLGLIAQLLLEPGDKVINCPPTFGMYKFIVDVSGAQEVNVARTPSYDLDVEAIRDAIDDRTKMVFITSPNNPTGNSVTDAEIIPAAGNRCGCYRRRGVLRVLRPIGRAVGLSI